MSTSSRPPSPDPERTAGYGAARALFEDYAREPERYWPAEKAGRDLQIRKLKQMLDMAAEARGTTPEGIVERVGTLALARAARRPPPIYVMGLGGSGSHWLAEMLAEILDSIYAIEVYLPQPLLEAMDSLAPDQQGFVADCLHLAHAPPDNPVNARLSEEELLAARAVNPAAGVAGPRLKLRDPECFVVQMLRDPFDRATSVTFRKSGYRHYIAPEAPDDEYMLRSAKAAVNNYRAWLERPPGADFVCRYERLRESPERELGQLLSRLGAAVEPERVAEVASSHDAEAIRRGELAPRGNIHLDEERPRLSRRQRALLHAELVEMRTEAGYPPDECLGHRLERPGRGERRLRLPPGGLGTLLVREPNTQEPGWRVLGEAEGKVRVPAGVELKLRVAESAGTEALASLAELRAGDLEALCLAGNANLDDDALAAIAASLGGLRELDLARTGISGEAVERLAGSLPRLEGLSLLGTEVSEKRAESLRRANPSLEIVA
jgi:hypothetical protein